MEQNPIPSGRDDLKVLLEENLKLSKDIYAATQKTRRYIMWGEVMSFLRLLIIMVPLVLGYLYLRPYLEQSFAMAREFLGAGTMQTPNGASGGPDIMGIIRELQKQGALQVQPTPTQ